jgi:hypothetical protein
MALDLEVIAKGIERGETIDKLLDLSCRRGQGSFISVPIAANELAPILRNGVVRIGATGEPNWRGLVSRRSILVEPS